MEGGPRRKLLGPVKETSAEVNTIRNLKSEGKGTTEIATLLEIGRASVYRMLEVE